MVEFTCTALGGPGNTFTWTRELDGMLVSFNQTLLITSPNADDGSTYACSVENEAGNETVAVTLNGQFVSVSHVPCSNHTLNHFPSQLLLLC